MSTMSDKFRGCLLGAAIGDIAGAVVEAESPGYIAAMCRSVDEIIAVESFDEFSGPKWMVGRFTDDTQMMLCVAEWLLNVSASDTRLEFAISNTGLSGRPE
jgi:ADP-ribosylglycohydrolase